MTTPRRRTLTVASRARREAALKAWETRRLLRNVVSVSPRSEAARKAWISRRSRS